MLLISWYYIGKLWRYLWEWVSIVLSFLMGQEFHLYPI
ncbi:hypothetical protein MNB_SV-6-177 [hydrothermal vent metagenome]|uniref:Uncharacterized protein n=1 Tax=hydrothermal vent metagenome TaxID=652676 RepID=A0A1W1BGB2_9ZZZZ